MERYFQISFHALILTAFVALADTGRLDALSIVIFLAVFAAAANRAFRGRPPLLGARTAFLLSLGYIFFFVIDAFILSRSFISAIIHMVLFLEMAKLAQKKEDKDYLYLILLAFLEVLAASSLTIDMSFVVTLLLFLVALVSTLMSFDIYRSQRQAAPSGAIRIEGPLGGMSVWATIWIVLVGVGLFFAIPRFGTGYFSRAAPQALLLSGFTESVDLGEIGEVKLSTALVMRTRLVEGTPSAVPKWRGVVLDTFDGDTWYKTDRRRRTVSNTRGNVYQIRPLDGTGESVRFEIFLEPLATSSLFGPHAMRTIVGEFRGLERDSADSVYQRAQSVRRTRYEVVSEVPGRDPLRESTLGPGVVPGLDAPDEIYLQLPADLDPRISALADEITAGAETVFQKASLIETYLKRNYDYSLNLTWDPGDQPLGTFLFEVRSGHCEYFASAMAIMLRATGVPTRMVNGFLAGEYNSIGNSYIVRQSDAHSWVEAYVPGLGWVEFDPTPADPGEVDVNLALLIAHYLDAAELFWNSYVLTYDSGTQLQLFRSAQESVQAMQRALRQRSDRWVVQGQTASDRFAVWLRSVVENRLFWIVVLAAVGAGFGWVHRRAIRTHWKIWNARRGRSGADREVVTELFYRVAALAGRRARPRMPHETWREWIATLPDEGRRRLIRAALEAFEKSRYSGRPITAEEYAQLERAIEQLKNA